MAAIQYPSDLENSRSPNDLIRPAPAEDNTMESGSTQCGQLNSPLLRKLPAEVRLQIYDLTFNGSIVRISRFPSTPPVQVGDAGREDDEGEHGEHREGEEDTEDGDVQVERFAMTSSAHKNLLHTCRAIYEDARASYWSATEVHFLCHRLGSCGGDGVFIRPNGTCRAAHGRPDLLLELDLLPALAKARVRRVEISSHYGIEWPVVRHSPVTLVLAALPQLEICVLRQFTAEYPWYTVDNSASLEENILAASTNQLDPEALLRAHLDLQLGNVRAQIIVARYFQFGQWGQNFLNYSTGRYLMWYDYHRLGVMTDRFEREFIDRVVHPAGILGTATTPASIWTRI